MGRVRSVSMKPGVQAFTTSAGFSRATTWLYMLRQAFERPYAKKPSCSPKPTFVYSAGAAPAFSRASGAAIIASMSAQEAFGSMNAACFAGVHLATKLGPIAEEMKTMRPPVCTSPTKASVTRLQPRTFVLSMLGISPSATPALLTMAYSFSSPSFSAIAAAAAVTEASSPTSMTTTLTRSASAPRPAAAASPRTLSREPRSTRVSGSRSRICEQMARPIPLLAPVTRIDLPIVA
mmetsp:Transcript_12379/g.31308  ORF Transcript_12379/g.31308 Transcript_12379/m.31308 type:complete len:235 (+) Transcript_12379:329-1033(+)